MLRMAALLLIGLCIGKLLDNGEPLTMAPVPKTDVLAKDGQTQSREHAQPPQKATPIGEGGKDETNIAQLDDDTFATRSFSDRTPNKNEPTASPDLLRLMGEFREDLWPEKPAPSPAWYRQFQRLPEEPLHRSQANTIAWHPVYCKTIGISWTEEEVISEGNTNVVSIVRDTATGTRYIRKTYDNPDELINELHFLTVANHEHIVKPICHQRDEERPAAGATAFKEDGAGVNRASILLELVDGMSAQQYAICCATEEDLKRVTAQLIVTLEYINWLGFVHADVKPKNVMIRKDGNIVVIDFGFTTRVEYARKGRGTPATISPEIAYRAPGKASEAADWWAFAVTIAMLFGARLRAVEAAKAVLKAQRNGQHGKISPMEFMPKITAIRAKMSGGEESLTSLLPASLSSSFNANNNGKRRTKPHSTRRTYVPICFRDGTYERQPTPQGFSDDLRRFIFMFMSLNPEERRFNTTRLLEFIHTHPFLAGINWPALPSPMAQGDLFEKEHRAVKPAKVVSSEDEDDVARYPPMQSKFHSASSPLHYSEGRQSHYRHYDL